MHRRPGTPETHRFRYTLSRRSLLRAGALGLGALALPLDRSTAARAATDPYAALRATWTTMITGGAIDPTNAAYSSAVAQLESITATWAPAMDATSSPLSLWPDLPIGSVSANVSSSYTRLRTLALAYCTPGTSYTGSTALAAQITTGLDWMAANAYLTSLPQYGYNNWWDWQVGSPQALEDTAVLMYSALSSTQIADYCAAIDHFVTNPTLVVQSSGTTAATGANLLDLCRVLIVRGALGADATPIATGVADMSPSFPYVTTGDGHYPDGSYIQHSNIAYTGSYGMVYFSDVVLLTSLLAGSQWAVTDPNLTDVWSGLTGCIAPQVYNGLMLDAVSGRAVSRYGYSDASAGTSAATMLVMAAAATTSPTQASQWRGIAKGWLQRGVTVNRPQISAQPSIPDIGSLVLQQSVLTDPAITATPEPVAFHMFPCMNRAVHRAAGGWAFAISMSSPHIARYESLNGENLHGWHTGDGMTYLYLDADPHQFNDAFWDTVDPYTLPGTTLETDPLANAAGAASTPTSTWVGGTGLAGLYGAVGMQLKGLDEALVATKAWFCLDDCVVALGAGITNSGGYDNRTVIENRNLHTSGGNALTVGGTEQSTTPGWTRTFTDVGWASLGEVAGYVFPGGATIEGSLLEVSGNWDSVNTLNPTTPTDTRPYQALWFDHGDNPAGAGYSYVLLPGYSAAQTQAWAAAPAVSVLANTASVQAIGYPSLGVTMANFYAAGTAGPLTVNAPACVAIQQQDGTLSVSVSDPTRAATTIQVTIAASGYTTADPGTDVTVQTLTSSTIVLQVDVSGSLGMARTATFTS